MGRRIFSALPGILTVCLVAVAAAYLIAHPPVRTMTAASTPDTAEPSVGHPAAPSTPPASAPPAAALAPGVIANTPVGIPESAPVQTPPEPKAAPAIPPSEPPPAIALPQSIVPPPPPPAVPEVSPLTSPQFHVQAGAFRVRGNAEDLVQQLRTSHYPAVIINRGPLFLVWVGPGVDRPAAERLMKALQADGFEAALSVSQ